MNEPSVGSETLKGEPARSDPEVLICSILELTADLKVCEDDEVLEVTVDS